MIRLLRYYFHLPANFIEAISNYCELKIDQGKTQYTIHLFSLTYIFLEPCNTSSKVNSAEMKTIGNKINCNPYVFLPWPVRRTKIFLLFYLWHQRHFGDIKMKQEKSAPCNNELMKYTLVMVSQKVTL